MRFSSFFDWVDQLRNKILFLLRSCAIISMLFEGMKLLCGRSTMILPSEGSLSDMPNGTGVSLPHASQT
jgi:hypothetical protein